MSDVRQTICIDFDNVIHSYGGWDSGQGPGHITGTVIPGAKEAIAELRRDYKIIVLSARASSPAGARGIARWLKEHGIEVDHITAIKLPAIVYVDDRALRFEGDWADVLQWIREYTCVDDRALRSEGDWSRLLDRESKDKRHREPR